LSKLLIVTYTVSMLILKMQYFRIHKWLTLYINKVYARTVHYNYIHIFS